MLVKMKVYIQWNAIDLAFKFFFFLSTFRKNYNSENGPFAQIQYIWASFVFSVEIKRI